MSDDDLTTFLTDYAPNLVRLEVDRIHENKKTSGKAIIKAVHKADRIILDKELQKLAEASTSNSAILAGTTFRPEISHRKLVHVIAHYKLRLKEMKT